MRQGLPEGRMRESQSFTSRGERKEQPATHECPPSAHNTHMEQGNGAVCRLHRVLPLPTTHMKQGNGAVCRLQEVLPLLIVQAEITVQGLFQLHNGRVADPPHTCRGDIADQLTRCGDQDVSDADLQPGAMVGIMVSQGQSAICVMVKCQSAAGPVNHPL